MKEVLLAKSAGFCYGVRRAVEQAQQLAQTQKVVRMWIRELPNGCPNEDDLNEVREFINNDYGKYFKAEGPAQ